MKYFLFALSVILPFANKLHAQNVSSPYSILGIGDIETKDYGKYSGMGSTSLALSSPSYLNFNNPASLTSLELKMMNLDMYMRGRVSKFVMPGADTLASQKASKDFVMARVALGFKVTKNWGFSIGIKPYSTVSYALNKTDKLFGGTEGLNKTVDGSGGINQVYFANGYKINKNLSAGLTSSYLFGSLIRNTDYTNSELQLDISRHEYNALYAFQFQAGLQYKIEPNKNLSHQIGLTISNKTSLHSQLTNDYTSADVDLKKEITDGTPISIPLQLGIGYAVIINNEITLAADYNFYNWKKQKVEYTDSYIDKSNRLSVGFEYSQKTAANREKMFLQLGVVYEKGYLNINNNSLNNISATAGLGFNLSHKINCYAGFEVGQKGNLGYDQIKEKYTQYNVGFTFRDLWFNVAKYGRYN